MLSSSRFGSFALIEVTFKACSILCKCSVQVLGTPFDFALSRIVHLDEQIDLLSADAT